jgi:hypothetical protein
MGPDLRIRQPLSLLASFRTEPETGSPVCLGLAPAAHPARNGPVRMDSEEPPSAAVWIDLIG